MLSTWNRVYNKGLIKCEGQGNKQATPTLLFMGLFLHLRPNYIHSASNDIHTDGPRARARARARATARARYSENLRARATARARARYFVGLRRFQRKRRI